MRTFGLLQEEKKRLLDSIDRLRNKQRATTTNEAGEKVQQQQQQLRQQMNDFNRRQHAVVQRMSAHDRYKRKKTAIYKAAKSTTAQRVDHERPTKPTTEGASQAADHETKPADLTPQSIIIITEEETGMQSDDEGVAKQNPEIVPEVRAVQPVAAKLSRPEMIAAMANAARMGRQKLVAFDTHLDQCMEMAELLESRRFDSSDDESDLEWKQLKEEIKQCNKRSAAADERYIQSKRKTDEFLARNSPTHQVARSSDATATTTTTTSRPQPARATTAAATAAAQSRISECERHLYKTMEEHHRYLDWFAKYPLIARRRANQSANAG